MAKRRNHYVPRFYLKAFEAAPGRLHLLNLKRSLEVKNAKLRHQCYRRKLYGPSDDIEDKLSHLEGWIAPCIQTIRDKEILPSPQSDGHQAILAFVALQLLRTPARGAKLNQLLDKAMKQVYSKDPRLVKEEIERLEFGFKNPVLWGLRNATFIIECIRDLSARLVVSPDNMFLTSDNPAFKYNQYCEEIQYQGTTGAKQRGLQIFVPVSPRLLLILYDREVYDLRFFDRFSRKSKAAQSDVDSLNKMQLISADENVYFSNWEQLEYIRGIFSEAENLRSEDPAVVLEVGGDNDPNESLIHMYEETANLSLKLTFLHLRKEARQVPIEDRPRFQRNEPIRPNHRGSKGRTKTYSRFLGRR